MKLNLVADYDIMGKRFVSLFKIDGSANLVTTDAAVSHRYLDTGSFTVSVTATDGTSTLSYTFPQPISISGFSCDFAMLTTNGWFTAEQAAHALSSLTGDSEP